MLKFYAAVDLKKVESLLNYAYKKRNINRLDNVLA